MGLQLKPFQNIYGSQRPQPPLVCTLLTNLQLRLCFCSPLCYCQLVPELLHFTLHSEFKHCETPCLECPSAQHNHVSRESWKEVALAAQNIDYIQIRLHISLLTWRNLRSSSHCLTGITLSLASFHSLATTTATRLADIFARASSRSSVFFPSCTWDLASDEPSVISLILGDVGFHRAVAKEILALYTKVQTYLS